MDRLASANALDDVAADSSLAQLVTHRGDVVDLESEAVPAARFGCASVGQS